MAPDLRCSRVARALGYRPAGTAGSAAAFVLVEAPLPWPSDVGTHPLLAPLAPVVGGAGGRLQAVVPRADAEPGATTVVVLRRAAVGFDRIERVVPTADLAGELAALLAAGLAADVADAADVAEAGKPDPGASSPGASSTTAPVRDVLVCTHGTRDVCCGADG
ncbi:MAG TPA: hypothetical protein VIL36_17565, partial [Acidimicrobiales bacterium]